MSTRTVHDPFLGKDVQVSNRLKDRLRGKYAVGPTMPNGEPEFGWRQHDTPPVQHEAAALITALEADGREATRLLDLWSEIPGAEDFAPYQDTMAFLGKPNSVGWVWARQVREERDFDKEQARQRDLAMQCICAAEEREQAAHARTEALEAALREQGEPAAWLETYWEEGGGKETKIWAIEPKADPSTISIDPLYRRAALAPEQKK